MRCTQPYGLSHAAEQFLCANAIVYNLCVHCNRSDGFAKEPIRSYGMFDEFYLYCYLLKGGRKAEEFIQRETWSSGPMIWLGLRVDDGQVFLWDEKDME